MRSFNLSNHYLSVLFVALCVCFRNRCYERGWGRLLRWLWRIFVGSGPNLFSSLTTVSRSYRVLPFNQILNWALLLKHSAGIFVITKEDSKRQQQSALPCIKPSSIRIRYDAVSAMKSWKLVLFGWKFKKLAWS